MRVRGHDFTLTEVEEACGVTEQSITGALARAATGRTAHGGRKLIFDGATPPAVCRAAARAWLGHDGVDFLGLNSLGMPVYGEGS